MSEIPKAYEPQSVEDKWYDFWLKQGCFTADPARVSAPRPAYALVIRTEERRVGKECRYPGSPES